MSELAPLGSTWTPPGGFDPSANGAGPGGFALALDEFIAETDEDVRPLVGTPDEAIVPTGGLVIVAGKPGTGKTTLLVDAALHWASQAPWLGFPCPRPLRLLVLENEGPIRQFRRKLREKRQSWPHPIAGAIFVQTWRWGSFSIAHDEARDRLAEFLREQAIDVVIGDPLGTLGVRGVGSPEDTRDFVKLLVELGLTRDRAFVFLHHLRKEGSPEELDQVSGAWGGHLDTLMVLKPTQRTDELRLSFPKVRWADRRERKPLILGLVHNTKTFELLGEEGDPRLLETAIVELLADLRWRTVKEIAAKGQGGIGVREKDVRDCLDANAHLFRSAPGNEHGRSPRATVWQLLPASGAVGSSSAEGASLGHCSTAPLPIGSSSSSPAALTDPVSAGAVGSSSPDEELDWR